MRSAMMRRGSRSGLVVALAFAGCGGAARERALQAGPGLAPAGAGVVAAAGSSISSNIVREDYVGSKACQPCHGEIYAAWLHSPMHEMTRLPEQARVRAPFDGAAFHFKNDHARFETAGGARLMRVTSADFGDHLYRVTKVIGGRYREDFAGVEVSPHPDAAAVPGPRSPASRAELILPISYVFASRSFRLKGYSVMVGERPGLRAGGVWNQTCVFCHNTNPYFDSTWGALYGPDAPGYQGAVVDRLLPPARRFAFEITDAAGLTQALAREIAFLGEGWPRPSGLDAEALRGLLGAGMRTLRRDLTPAHFVEVGIGCESCHGGAREHVQSPQKLPDFVPRSRFLRARAPGTPGGEPTRAEAINRTCARCHQVLFSRYPFTWEGGLRQGEEVPGGSSITSGEARDFLLGGCARQMACTTCHDPHAEDRPDKLAALATSAGNPTCTRCHTAYAAPDQLRRHAHHDPAGAGGSCVGCHMPRKNMGLGYALTRYHRIGSPTDRVRVEQDRPLECALCHADRSVGRLVDDMERLWGKRYDRAALARLYGGLDANPLIATVERGKAHEQAPAIAVLGEQRVQGALAAVARQLVHPIPLVRYYARRAVEAIRGAPCAVEVDLDRTTPEIAAAARRCVPGAWPVAPVAGARAPPPAAVGGSGDDD
jgi:predicted CXXCH cytochrome family protein